MEKNFDLALLEGHNIEELQTQLKGLYKLVPDNGDISDDLLKEIEFVDLQIEQRISNYRNVLDTINIELNLYKKQKDEIDGKRRQLEMLKDEIYSHLINESEEPIVTENYSLSFKDTESINLKSGYDIDNFAISYPMLIRRKPELNKIEIKRILKEKGVLPEGIEIIEKKTPIIKYKGSLE